jgi:isoquinoline 1-oxidoreductase beta subunit
VRQAAKLALMIKRPVQFFWSRGEDMMHDRFGGACAATLTAQVLPNGGVNAWQSALAAPATMAELKSRTLGGQTSDAAMRANAGGSAPDLLATAQPLYTIPNVALDFHAADIGIPTGPMRGGAGIATCFFNESFINELSSKSGVEPLSFRMALLGNNQRLAQCLAKVTALAGWSGGGQGTNQGIASYTTDDACIAVVAEAKFTENGRLRVSKLTAVADVGQLVNPDIARQQIEGGLLFGISIAVSAPVVIKNGIPGPIKLGDLHLPRMSEMPEINIELILNNAPSADIWDLAVPPVAPAIAGALFAGSGKRYRTLPFTVAQSE